MLNKISVQKGYKENVQSFIVFLCPIQSVLIEKGHNPSVKKNNKQSPWHSILVPGALS